MAVDQEEIHRLSLSENVEDRFEAARLLQEEFESLPDKSAAWDELHRLTGDEEWFVREGAVSAVDSTFMYIPNKSAAWSDLQRLASDKDSSVRESSARALGSAFEYIPDKSAAWNDLHKLALDEDWYVRMYANHSLGKICIYIASNSESEDKSQTILGEAIRYFERGAKEPYGNNPATFCNLFYRSFDAVIFKKVSSKKEIESYIAAAKEELQASESKQKLFEVVEQLAEVLETAKNARMAGADWRESLKRCSEICNHVDQLMDENKNKTPAIHKLYIKTKISFNLSIKEIIEDVKKKAEEACREAKGTDAEQIAYSIKRESRGWQVENQEQMTKSLDNLVFSLKMQVPNVSGNEYMISKIDEMRNCTKVEDQMAILAIIIPLISTISIPAKMTSLEEKMESLNLNVEQILSSIKQIKISLKPSIKEEIQVTVGLSGLGSGAQHVITIPLQEISYPKLKEDLQKYSDKMLDIAKLPRRLKDKIMEYIRKNEDKLKGESAT